MDSRKLRWMVVLVACFASGCASTHGSVSGRSSGSANGDTSQLERMQKADKAYKASRWGEARQGYESVIDGDPENARALFRLGVLAYQRGNIDKAEEYFQHARSASDGGYPKATYDLGILHVQRAYGLLGGYAERLEQRLHADSSAGRAADGEAKHRLRSIKKLRSAIKEFRRAGASANR